jgi:hypothetical protein
MFSWQDYIDALLDAAKRSGVDLDGHDLSPLELMTFSDVANSDPLAANWSILELGDTVPPAAGPYAPTGGVFVSYWVFLSYVAQSLFEKTQPASTSGAFAASPALAGGGPTTGFDFDAYRDQLKKLLPIRPIPETTGGPSRVVRNTASSADALRSAGSLIATGNFQSLHGRLAALLAEVPGDDASAVGAAINACAVAASQADSTYNMQVRPAPLSQVTYCPRYRIPKVGPVISVWRQGSFGEGATIRLTSVGPNPTSPELVDAASMGLRNMSGDPIPANDITEFQISFLGFSVFEIERGGWFDPGMLARHITTVSDQAPDFFKPDGALARLPSHVLIGFSPTIQIHTATEDAAVLIKSNLKSIGPFDLTAGGGVSAALVQQGTTVSIDVTDQGSGLPILVGVASQRPASADI